MQAVKGEAVRVKMSLVGEMNSQIEAGERNSHMEAGETKAEEMRRLIMVVLVEVQPLSRQVLVPMSP